jgi:hypothetical protein
VVNKVQPSLYTIAAGVERNQVFPANCSGETDSTGTGIPERVRNGKS